MYSASTFVKNKLNEENRVIVAKVEIEGLSNPLISELQKITLKNGFCGRQYLTIGQTNSKYIDVTFYSEENLSLKSKKVTLSFGVKNGTTVEYTKMGNFKITEYDKEGNIYTFTAYDEMNYLYGATAYTVDSAKNTPKLILDGIASDFDTTYRIDGFSGLTGYSLKRFNNVMNNGILSDINCKTYRDVLGAVASLFGCNVFINFDGVIVLAAWTSGSVLSVSKSRYYKDTLKLDFEKTAFDDQILKTDLAFNGENPKMKLNIYLQSHMIITNKYDGYTYRGGEVKFLGNYLLEPNDWVYLVNDAGEDIRILPFSFEHEWDGGIVTRVVAYSDTAEAELDSSYDIVNNNIGETSASVDSLQETVNEHSTSISNIKSRLDTQSNTISTLNSTVDTHGTNISKLTTDLESLEEMNDNNTVYAYGYVGNSNCNALIPCRLIMQKSSPNKANVHMTGYIQSITGNSEFYVFELSIITGLLGLSSLTIDAKKTTVVLDQHLCENPSLIQAYMGYGLTFDGWTIGRIYDYDGSSGGWPSNAPVHQAGTYFIIDIYDATYS